MPFVIDASVALAWCFGDEASPATQALLATLDRDYAAAPAIWPFEVSNALVMAARRGRISTHDVDGHLLDLLALPIRIDAPPDSVALGIAVALARAHRLTIYDAAYLELALRLNLAIATTDEELMTAARAEGVQLR